MSLIQWQWGRGEGNWRTRNLHRFAIFSIFAHDALMDLCSVCFLSQRHGSSSMVAAGRGLSGACGIAG
jgi:hypothetical protein